MKRKFNYKPIVGFASFVLVSLVLVSVAHADGTEELGPPNIDIAEGSGILVAGTGLNTNQPGDISIAIPGDVTVAQVLLYWTGRSVDPADHTATDTIMVNSTDLTGDLIGGPTPGLPDDRASVTYRADITASNWVVAGAVNVLTVDDLDFDYQNDGAAVVVIYDDGTSTDIMIMDGNDFAYHRWGLETVPVEFPILPSEEPQVGYMWVILSDIALPRPAAVDVTVAGDTTRINVTDASLGDFLNVLAIEVSVPAGADSVIVQPVSVPSDNPDSASLAWSFVSWELPDPVDEGCTYTIGYFKNHEEDWPAENPGIFTDEEAMELLWAKPKGGNAYIILAKQYIGAALNVGNETSIPDEVFDAWLEAQELLLDYESEENIPKKTDDRDDAIYLAGILDDYNNGLLGPGHCD